MVMSQAANSIALVRQVGSKAGARYVRDARFALSVVRQHRDKLPKLPG
jgi:hypothetical protein